MIYLISSNIIFLFLFIFFIIKYFRLIKNKKDLYFQKVKNEIDNNIFEYRKTQEQIFQATIESYDKLIENTRLNISLLESELKEKQEKCDNLSKHLDDLEVQGKERIDKQLKDYEDMHRKYMYEKLEQDDDAREEELIHNFLIKKEQYKQQLQEELNKIEEIKGQLNEYQEKQKTINEEILRRRELAEQATFYSINLTKNEIQDIIYLKEFEDKIFNKEALNKAIYETYYKKPLAEMVKRVTKGKEFSGIYKITSTLTNEIYIGRAVNISKRWVDHIKSSLGIGNLVSSTLHKRLNQDGCWNFTFEVLEEVPKDELAKRESYWINFYESNIYGLNMRKELKDE